MLRIYSCALILAALALLSVAVAISARLQSHQQAMSMSVQWHDDLDAAFRIAKQSGKDVLVIFTARRQCLACELLKRQVLVQPEFLDYVGSRFVLVELDKSSLEDDGTKAAKLRRLEAWQFQYRAGSVPTVLLLDQSGRPYGITHHRGGGPTKFVEFLEQCRTARSERDRLLGEAQLLSGQLRALKLDEALDVVANLLTDDVTLDEPPLMAFYAAEVRDILGIESSVESVLYQKYTQMQQKLKEAQARNSMSQKFDEITETGGYEAAIKYADELLTEATDPSLRRRLKRYRRFYLEWAHRFEEALDETRDQLRDPELTEKERHHLEDREAFYLVRLGRRDEAFAIIDRWTVGAGDDRNKRRIAYQEKGQFHYYLKEWSDAATTFDMAAQFSDDGTEEWWENKAMSANALLFGKDPAAAKQAYEKLLHRTDVAADLRPHLLLKLIESLLATNDRVQADALRVRFRQAITECPKDLLPPEDAKRLLRCCDELFAEANRLTMFSECAFHEAKQCGHNIVAAQRGGLDIGQTHRRPVVVSLQNLLRQSRLADRQPDPSRSAPLPPDECQLLPQTRDQPLGQRNHAVLSSLVIADRDLLSLDTMQNLRSVASPRYTESESVESMFGDRGPESSATFSRLIEVRPETIFNGELTC